MQFLTLEYIKAHSRIDFNCDDSLLELYADSAEGTIFNICNRTYDEIVENFGTTDYQIPAPIIQAGLILVETSYLQRGAVSLQNLYVVPYSFDMLIKPYMKLL